MWRRSVRSALLSALALLPLEGAHAADPVAASVTVIGSANNPLVEGAEALMHGRVSAGIELTLKGLAFPASLSDQAAGHANLCAGYAMQLRWSEALPHCNMSVAINASSWHAYNNRAAVLTGFGLHDLAMEDVKSALALAPDAATLLETRRIVESNLKIHNERTRRAIRA